MSEVSVAAAGEILAVEEAEGASGVEASVAVAVTGQVRLGKRRELNVSLFPAATLLSAQSPSAARAGWRVRPDLEDCVFDCGCLFCTHCRN